MVAVACLSGPPGEMGRAVGEMMAVGVRSNVQAFWAQMKESGWHQDEVRALAMQREADLTPARLEEMDGVATGAGLDYRDVLAYNVFGSVAVTDDCTVMMAVGAASASGRTLFLKNSDKVGGPSLVGPNFHRFKEINVVMAVRAQAGHLILGVTAAGSTGLKMGVNSLGVVAGANLGRTEAMYQRSLNLTQIRAIDRYQLLRDGLERPEGTAVAATQDTVTKIIASPMATSGNVEWADAREAFIVEGSYTEVAVQTVRDDVAARSNCFQVMKSLNRWNDVSSQCRYVRAMELMQPRKGQLTFADFMAMSQDHENGPGPNSVCRHGSVPEDEVSLSSMVVELDPETPARSRVAVSLGKPCHAWKDPNGHLHLTLEVRPEDIPEGFSNGDVWKRFYNEAPND